MTNYWKIRALTEQAAREETEAQLSEVRAQFSRLEARATRDKLMPLVAEAGLADGGQWVPDDEKEEFRRTDVQTHEPASDSLMPPAASGTE